MWEEEQQRLPRAVRDQEQRRRLRLPQRRRPEEQVVGASTATAADPLLFQSATSPMRTGSVRRNKISKQKKRGQEGKPRHRNRDREASGSEKEG